MAGPPSCPSCGERYPHYRVGVRCPNCDWNGEPLDQPPEPRTTSPLPQTSARSSKQQYRFFLLEGGGVGFRAWVKAKSEADAKASYNRYHRIYADKRHLVGVKQVSDEEPPQYLVREGRGGDAPVVLRRRP